MLRTARGLRACLVAVVLAAVSAASTLDGAAADFVAGDDGDSPVTRRQEEPALCAAAAPRTADVSAAVHRPPFLAAAESRRPAGRPTAGLLAAAAPSDLDCPVASPPLPARAPPAV